ncbi:hypothetical protein K504DRAFT_468812 [Pleomassaria siparia CBS 279.74]|uniref:Uncharacterized protein n=1 Tax=Pleomassaria siparia CBS 279.74 TaxID=1314801 RepID=A0A6G1K6T1_9PLEO|nr:hypothetical protein K504DRAFT_468812 [Pleomassaria siparia CBS 279.74]
MCPAALVFLFHPEVRADAYKVISDICVCVLEACSTFSNPHIGHWTTGPPLYDRQVWSGNDECSFLDHCIVASPGPRISGFGHEGMVLSAPPCSLPSRPIDPPHRYPPRYGCQCLSANDAESCFLLLRE